MASFGIRGLSKSGGINICCCRICTCVNFEFLSSHVRLMKMLELLIATICEGLLIRYGIPAADSIGQALTSFLTTTCSVLLHNHGNTCGLLLFLRQIGQSYSAVFETLFNAVACRMYFSSASYMGFSCVVWLHPQLLITPGFWAYPAMTNAYYLGYAASMINGIDAILAFKHFRGYR